MYTCAYVGQPTSSPHNPGGVRLYELLEQDCHLLDLQLAFSSEQPATCSASYQRYMDAKQKVMAIEEEIKQKESQLKGMEQLGTYIALVMSTTTTDPRLNIINSKADELRQTINSLVSTETH